MARQKDQARAAGKFRMATALEYDGAATAFHGYDTLDKQGRVLALYRDGAPVNALHEGELGVVGYAGGKASSGTDPGEAARFAHDTGVDALAVSVGNVHLQQDAGQGLDVALIRRIEAVTSLPLVIHGGSGVPLAQRAALSAGSQIAKFNIGTELRMAFGAALREAVGKDPARFDRVAILRDTEDPVLQATRTVFRGLGASGRV